MSEKKKVFSEKEATEIVRRAVELQEEQQSEAYTPGITSEQLADIAKEVGVDPKFLDQALREALAPESKVGPMHLTEEFERVIDGELPPEDFDLVFTEFKPMNSRRYQTVQVGRTMDAIAWTGWSHARLHLTSRNGRTRLRVKSTPLLAYLCTLHPAIIGSVIAMSVFSGAGMVAGGLAAFAGIMSAGILGFRFLLKRGHRAARELTDKIERAVMSETAALRQNLSRATNGKESEEQTQQTQT